MTRTSRTIPARLGALVLTLALVAACGDDDTDDASTPTEAATATTAPAAPADTTAAGDEGTPTTATAPSDGGEPLEIAFFSMASANTFAQALTEGLQERAAERGNVEVRVFDGAFDPNVQVSQIEDAIGTGRYDGFVIMPVAGALLVGVVQDAIEAGIAVVATNNPIGEDVDDPEPQVDGLVGSILEDNRGVGRMNGEMAIEACAEFHADDEMCEVVYITGGNTLPLEITKREGFGEALEGSSLEIVAEGEAGFLTDPALTLMQDVLQANPGVDVVVTGGDEMTLGAELAIQDAGREGEVTLIGVGSSSQAVEAVREGRWYATAAFIPFDEGRFAAGMLLDHLDGNPPEDQSVIAQDLIEVGRAITADNADDFAPQWSI